MIVAATNIHDVLAQQCLFSQHFSFFKALISRGLHNYTQLCDEIDLFASDIIRQLLWLSNSAFACTGLNAQFYLFLTSIR